MVNTISRLFGKSPVRPIQMHMQKAQAAVALLADFGDAVIAGDWSKAEEIRDAIAARENEADTLKNDLRTKLPQSLLMPVARADVLALLGMQDKLANKSKDIAGLVLGRKMEIPAAVAEEFHGFLLHCIETTQKALRAIEELDDLFETGFDKKERDKVDVFLDEVDRLESECDAMQIELRASLMEIEESMPPLKAMFLYRIIEEIAGISDIAHRVGNRLTILLAK